MTALEPNTKRELFYRIVGKKIRDRREKIGWTQTELAAALRCTRAHVCNVEHAKSRIMLHDLAKYALWLRVPVSHLLPDEYTKNRNSARGRAGR